MYVVDDIINGKSVYTVNYVHFHGLETNRDETAGPRKPFIDHTPLRCIYNTYDQPRIVSLSRMIFPRSVAVQIPESKYYQFLQVTVDKYVTLRYDADFSYIYKSREYIRDHDGYVDSLVANAPASTSTFKDAPFELVIDIVSQTNYANSATSEYHALDGHQSSRMERTIYLAPDFINTYKIVRVRHGIAFCDEYFEIIRPYLRDDYFCWQRYVEK